jgi:hypothetical protein
LVEGEGCVGVLEAFFPARIRKIKKIGVPRLHGKHAAWELLSPDLRCF